VITPFSILKDAPLAALDLSGLDQVDPEVAESFARTVATARAAGLEIDTLRLDHDFGRLRRLGLLVSEAEGYVVHQEALERDPEGFSPRFRQFVEWGARQPAHKLAAAYRQLGEMAEALREALSPYAGLLLPATPQTAFAFAREAPASQADFTSLGNILGLPATAFPVGLSADGLPLSAQALTWDDETALGLAAALTTPLGAPPLFQG
jgi:aspartyl-tRNA(Asn)/glutamyl-tRNA(Gln) amidotransferase subunit A